MASATPAPKPHSRRLPGDKFPLASTLRFLNSSKAPNLNETRGLVETNQQCLGKFLTYLTADFGMEP